MSYHLCTDYDARHDRMQTGIGKCELYDPETDAPIIPNRYTPTRQNVRCRVHPRRQARAYQTNSGWHRTMNWAWMRAWRYDPPTREWVLRDPWSIVPNARSLWVDNKPVTR